MKSQVLLWKEGGDKMYATIFEAAVVWDMQF